MHFLPLQVSSSIKTNIAPLAHPFSPTPAYNLSLHSKKNVSLPVVHALDL